jgi:hypothetical protein
MCSTNVLDIILATTLAMPVVDLYDFVYDAAGSTTLGHRDVAYNDLMRGTLVFLDLLEYIELICIPKLALISCVIDVMVVIEVYYKCGKQHPQIVSIRVGDRPVTRSNDVVYLELRIDTRLTWSAHINYIVSRIKQFRYMLTRLRCTFSPALRAHLSKVFIIPIIDLCSIIYASANVCSLRRLDVAYNDLMRTIAGTRRSDHISVYSLYRMSSLEPLGHVETVYCLVLCKRCLIVTAIA